MYKIALILVLTAGQFAYAALPQCDRGLTAFKKDAWPILKANCAGCHDGSMAPPHSSENAAEAYATALESADFADSANSRFAVRFKERHWLAYGGSEVTLKMDEFVGVLDRWWDEGQFACEEHWDYTSKELPIPELPTRENGSYKAVSWKVTETDSPLYDCTVSVDVQLFAPALPKIPGAYRLKNPRVQCPAGVRVSLAGLRFAVSGQTAVYENIFEKSSLKLSGSVEEQIFGKQLMIILMRGPADTLSFLIRKVSHE